MPTICPHCHTARPANSRVPDWQCPSCGKAYAKAGGGMAPRASVSPSYAVASNEGGSIPWGKLLAGLAIVYGAWLGFHKMGSNAAPSEAQLAQLAASRQASDVLLYSTSWCPYCRAAKGWMAQYGFKYEECDIEASSACASQLKALDPSGAVPYLIVRGQHMKDGFDSEKFVMALAK